MGEGEKYFSNNPPPNVAHIKFVVPLVGSLLRPHAEAGFVLAVVVGLGLARIKRQSGQRQ